jgi:hypothetical protein
MSTYLYRSRFPESWHSRCFKWSALNLKQPNLGNLGTNMKTLLLVSVMLASNLFAGTCDDIAKGSATGINRILLTLKPGAPQDVSWDFTQCASEIQNFTIFVTQPRNKNGFQPSLKPGTPLQVETFNLTSDPVLEAYWPGFICYMGTVSSSHIMCTLTLSPSAKRPMDVEVSYTAAY